MSDRELFKIMGYENGSHVGAYNDSVIGARKESLPKFSNQKTLGLSSTKNTLMR